MALILFFLSITAIFYSLFKHNKAHIALCIYLILSLMMALSENSWNLHEESTPRFALIDSTLDFFEKNSVPDDVKVYFGQCHYTGKLRYALYNHQMTYCYDEKMYDDIDFDHSILLVDTPITVSKYTNVSCYNLDKNEYLYTNNSQMEELISNMN